MSWNSSTKILGMPLFSIGQDAYGFFAVGQIARGIICFGQLGIGVINICQVGIGVISINQAGIGIIDFSINAGLGVFTFALAGIGIIFAYGMAVFGMISNQAGFYKFTLSKDNSEITTFSGKLNLLIRDIEINPFPMIIWLLLWSVIFCCIYIFYKKRKNKKIRRT